MKVFSKKVFLGPLVAVVSCLMATPQHTGTGIYRTGRLSQLICMAWNLSDRSQYPANLRLYYRWLFIDGLGINRFRWLSGLRRKSE